MPDNYPEIPSEISRRSLLISSLATTAYALIPAVVYAQSETTQSSAPPTSARSTWDAVEAVRDSIIRISHEVWANPELSLHEEISAEIHRGGSGNLHS